MADSVEYRILGPLEVSAGGTFHEISSVRQRIVLAMLLLHANQVVPSEALTDAVWNQSPPATARSQLQTCVAGLRRLLARIRASSEITTRPVGYMLVLHGDALDMETFERLVSQGRASAAQGHMDEAVRDLRAALALWRGPAAAVDVDSPLVQAVATRLNENRLTVLEECIDLELALGRHRDLAGELSGLVKQYPLREKLRAQHMLCLYRSGRQADALDSFREARQIFADELGLDPSKELRRLEEAILANDHALDIEPAGRQGAWPDYSGRAVPCQLPAAIADFTGRQDLLQLLTSRLSAGPDTGGAKYLPVVILTGKGGVGKTALALQVAHAVRQHYPDGQLFAELSEGDGQPVSVMGLVGQFLRALGLKPAWLPAELAERIAAYRTALSDRQVLIVLDNAHTVSQVLQLLPGSPTCAVIVTSRNPLAGLPGAQEVEVPDLDEQASVDLLAKIIGSGRVEAEPEAAHAIVRLCDYLPLALRIVAAKLATRTYWRLEKMVCRMTDDERRLDELALGAIGIRATLMVSCQGLGMRARRLFARLSLLGTADFASWVSAPLLDLDVGDAADTLDTLVEARLVEVRGTEDGSLRFRMHDLIRIYALEQLTAEEPTAERLAVLQRLLRCWLSLAAEAHRRSYGGDYAVLHGSATPWRLPDELVDELLANPMGWFRTERAGLVSAILQAAQGGFDELCWDLAVTSVTLFETEHHVEDWRKTHEAALEVTRRTGNARGEAAVLCSLGNLAVSIRPSEAVRYLDSALKIFKRIGDEHGQALALALLAYVDRQGGEHDRALARYAEALQRSRAVGDLISQIDALTSIAQIEMEHGRLAEAEERLSQALEICRSLKAPRMMAQTQHRLGEFFLCRGDLDRAGQTFRLVLDLVRAERDMVGEIYALVGRGTVYARQNAPELAEADLVAALQLSRQVGDNLAHGRVLLALAEFYIGLQAPERAVPLINEALVVSSTIGPAAVWREQFLGLRARLDEQIGFTPQAAAPG